MNDEELLHWLEKAISGDESAFNLVYEATNQEVYRTVSFLVYNKQDVEDIVNDVYLRMWRSIDSYDPNRPFRYWLHGIVVRRIQDWKRKAWRRIRLFERNRQMACEPFVRADEAIKNSELQQELFDLIFRLSYKLRVVVILRYFNDYALEEIANLLRIPVGTVKSRHHLALKQLRKFYELQGEDAYVH
ncbi:sigma-70 family RNA polymerase sigma factor [Cohnella hashimotonis]|uniref:Sigma-70 family RNA polymerase sigma factor n=1 Tax=Cohnella hashimotonis TaxID=2826895 RepID=A0ABT6TIV2_9BACL|nr:sigma-70 family RNA polymerase sigma factor [Cohnella hashimotonis]MDI4645879.1 sigma-70 family RNA polymerase sigma factor [Cohnella hashimotonis]